MIDENIINNYINSINLKKEKLMKYIFKEITGHKLTIYKLKKCNFEYKKIANKIIETFVYNKTKQEKIYICDFITNFNQIYEPENKIIYSNFKVKTSVDISQFEIQYDTRRN